MDVEDGVGTILTWTVPVAGCILLHLFFWGGGA